MGLWLDDSDSGPWDSRTPLVVVMVTVDIVARAVVHFDTGRFATRWVIPEAIGPGPRRITVRQNCESGKDGSLVLVTGIGWVFVR